MKRKRLFNRESKSLEEEYFYEIRPKLYQNHSTHRQHGTRTGRSLAEHLDSACQFVLTVSKIATVSEEKRGCILAATAVHDLNKLDNLRYIQIPPTPLNKGGEGGIYCNLTF
ncbi:MAG: hypothetical protein ACLFM2_00630 [Halothece sp.]